MTEKCLVINYRTMSVGGIETYIYNITKYCLENNIKVIWLADVNYTISPQFKEVMADERIVKIKVNTHSYHWFKHAPIIFSPDCHYTILSFSLLDHLHALELKKKSNNITVLYAIPHFEGWLIQPDSIHKGIYAKFLKKYIAKFYDRCSQNNELMCFNEKHFRVISERYQINIQDSKNKILPKVIKMPEFPLELVKERAKERCSCFKIVSAGRMEFPHKAYMVGLVDAFSTLKTKFPQIQLYYIGDGPSKAELVEHINKLPIEIRKDIYFRDFVPPNELAKCFNEFHLNISVAGCFSAGCKAGLVSIPVRHYSYSCEAYEINDRSKSLGAEPGDDVKEKIVSVITCDENEYVQLCLSAYNKYKVDDKAQPEHLFEIRNIKNNKISFMIKLVIMLETYLQKILYLLNKKK